MDREAALEAFNALLDAGYLVTVSGGNRRQRAHFTVSVRAVRLTGDDALRLIELAKQLGRDCTFSDGEFRLL
jgi:hypothetical protein